MYVRGEFVGVGHRGLDPNGIRTETHPFIII